MKLPWQVSPTKAAKKTAKKNEKTQRERFIEAARSIGVDETGKEFEAALKKITAHKARQA